MENSLKENWQWEEDYKNQIQIHDLKQIEGNISAIKEWKKYEQEKKKNIKQIDFI